MEKNLWIFFSIVFLSIAIEHAVKPICMKGALLSLLHHILAIFMILSPFMFKEYQLQIFLTVFIWIGWRMFDGTCIATQKYNEICEKDRKDRFMSLQGVLTEITGFDWNYGIGLPLLLFSTYKIFQVENK